MPNKYILYTVALSLFCCASLSIANDFSKCPQFFAGGAPPITKQAAHKTRALCFDEFAVLHSSYTKTPVYVAQWLSAKQLDSNVPRATRFFADARLPRAERAELEDYKGSGFDRGHMAPAGDMATESGMAQSFSLANIVPQHRVNNQRMWKSIETATRKYVMRASGDVYVITGVLFDSNASSIGANAVRVPNYLYKLVYDPATGKAWAHWLENSDEAQVSKPISYKELVDRTGIKFLPNSQL